MWQVLFDFTMWQVLFDLTMWQVLFDFKLCMTINIDVIVLFQVFPD